MDKPPAIPRWTWRHIVAGIVLVADLSYVIAIVSGIAWSNHDRLVHPAVSHIIVCGLGVTTAITIYLAIEGQRRARQDQQFIILATALAQLREKVADQQPGTPGWDEPTVPNVRATRVVYASASVAQTAQHDTLIELIEQRLSAKIEELGQREYWRGYGKCATDGLAGVGSEIVQLPGARMGRPRSSR